MRLDCRVAAFVILVAGAAFAQQTGQRPAYEAASVKLDNSGSGHSSSNGSKGQIVFTNVSLKRLVERAYSVKPLQVTGPDWMENVRVDIVAKYPKDTKREDQPLMLRALLEERFKLAVHYKTEELPGYSLVVAKGGFKLKPGEAGGGSDTSTNGNNQVQTLTAKTTPMTQLADILTRHLGEMVVDRTGIEGVYNFELRWADDDQKADAGAVDTVPSVFTALQETLGLRLKPEKVPTDIIVVDHLERVPVEN
jgi:uncharacterized protein (TIGR03435 family)